VGPRVLGFCRVADIVHLVCSLTYCTLTAMQRFDTALIHGMAHSAALTTVSARTHSVAALAGVLPLINAAVNWSNVRQILDCIVEAAASTLARFIRCSAVM